MKLKNQPKETKKYSSIAEYSSMAFQMVAIIGAGVFGGYKLDHWLNNRFPWFTVILSFVSVILAVYLFIKDLIFMNHK